MFYDDIWVFMVSFARKECDSDRVYTPSSNLTFSNDNIFTQISNLEKLIEVQNSMFTATIEDLQSKLKQESDKRLALQAEVEKLAQCVTQV